MSRVRVHVTARADRGLFSSRTVTAHLLRGLIAAGLGAWALSNAVAHPVIALCAGGLAVVAMRGCPMCWTVGLFETIAARWRERS